MKVHLSDFVAERGQAGAAVALGVSAPAICKALHSGREIYVTPHKDGTCEAHELRPFPSHKRKPA